MAGYSFVGVFSNASTRVIVSVLSKWYAELLACRKKLHGTILVEAWRR